MSVIHDLAKPSTEGFDDGCYLLQRMCAISGIDGFPIAWMCFRVGSLEAVYYWGQTARKLYGSVWSRRPSLPELDSTIKTDVRLRQGSLSLPLTVRFKAINDFSVKAACNLLSLSGKWVAAPFTASYKPVYKKHLIILKIIT